MKTKIEIINETAEFYSADPKERRGAYSLGYTYETSDGKKCAVGRCIKTDVDIKNLINVVRDLGFRDSSVHIVLDNILKSEYVGHSIDFWADLQNFHDNDNNWTDYNISEKGLLKKEILLEKYK